MSQTNEARFSHFGISFPSSCLGTPILEALLRRVPIYPLSQLEFGSLLSTISYGGGTIDTRTYDAGGRLSTETLGNGQVVTRTYQTGDNPSLTISETAVGNYNFGWEASPRHRPSREGRGEDAVVLLTDKTRAMITGIVVERYAYTSYGKLTILDGAGTTTRTSSLYDNLYLYTARAYDAESGLYYFHARMYEGRKGRLLSHDPIEYPDGPTTYAGWIAVKRTDLLGLWIDGPPDELLDATHGRDRTKRCIFTMHDSSGQRRWDDDARRLLGRSARGSVLFPSVRSLA